jgi:integrase
MVHGRKRDQEHRIKEAMTAVHELWEIIQFQMAESMMVRDAMASATGGTKRPSKYREIWDLQILIRFIMKGPLPHMLAAKDLMARAAALFMIFVPCRPIGMLRMNPRSETWDEDARTVEVTTQEKTNRGRDRTAAVIRAINIPQLCPLSHYKLLKARAEELGHRDTLWVSDAGKPFGQSAIICKLLLSLLRQAGIPEKFTAYSIRHALITALFELGFQETQVNAYTGHSNRSHTAVSSYFHLDNKWVGRSLIHGEGEAPKNPRVQATIEEDNQTNLVDEGIENED